MGLNALEQHVMAIAVGCPQKCSSTSRPQRYDRANSVDVRCGYLKVTNDPGDVGLDAHAPRYGRRNGCAPQPQGGTNRRISTPRDEQVIDPTLLDSRGDRLCRDRNHEEPVPICSRLDDQFRNRERFGEIIAGDPRIACATPFGVHRNQRAFFIAQPCLGGGALNRERRHEVCAAVFDQEQTRHR